MRFLSLCSGIEAASVAFAPMGWSAAAFAEIEAFPSAVLAHHYPTVPNLGDITKFKEWPDLGTIDLLVGGTPCQSFSVAGLRKGLADPRGNLMLTYLAIAQRYRPRWLVWENVPGVLSSNGGRDFGAFIRGLEECGYHAAWRVLDAQFVRVDGFGRAVPQRRRRVFVVGYLGDWRRAAAVLFERESLSGHPAPRRQPGQGVAPTISARPTGGGGLGTDFDLDGGLVQHAIDVAPCLRAGGNSTGGDRPYGTDVDTADSLIAYTPEIARCDATREGSSQDYETTAMVAVSVTGQIAHALKAEGADASEDGTGRGTPLLPVALMSNASGANFTAGEDISPTLRTGGDGGNAMAVAHTLLGKQNDSHAADLETYVAAPFTLAFDTTQITSPTNGSNPKAGDACHPLATGAHAPAVSTGWAVRRLMPIECERLQGFPEFLDRVTIEAWHSSDLHQTGAPAETQSLRSPECASIAGGSASPQHANPAAKVSSTSLPDRDLPVALNVLIDLERGEVQLRRAGRLIWSANTAAKPSASPLSMPLDDFVRLAAHMTQTAVPQTLTGRVASQASISGSSDLWNGSASVSVFGREIEELVSDAASFTTARDACMRSITSQSGHHSQNSEQTLRTLSCFVTAAISSFIPREIRLASSYTVIVETVRGYTAIQYRNKPAADGPRYQALGNSFAVNVVRWIGMRIQMVEALEPEQAAAGGSLRCSS